MPSKARRVAARQTQMTSKRKHKPQGRVASPPQPPVATPATQDAASAVQPAAAQQTPVPAPTTSSRPKGGFRSRSQARVAAEATPPAFNYIGPEMRRIGLVMGVMVVALVVLTFILR